MQKRLVSDLQILSKESTVDVMRGIWVLLLLGLASSLAFSIQPLPILRRRGAAIITACHPFRLTAVKMQYRHDARDENSKWAELVDEDESAGLRGQSQFSRGRRPSRDPSSTQSIEEIRNKYEMVQYVDDASDEYSEWAELVDEDESAVAGRTSPLSSGRSYRDPSPTQYRDEYRNKYDVLYGLDKGEDEPVWGELVDEDEDEGAGRPSPFTSGRTYRDPSPTQYRDEYRSRNRVRNREEQGEDYPVMGELVDEDELGGIVINQPPAKLSRWRRFVNWLGLRWRGLVNWLGLGWIGKKLGEKRKPKPKPRKTTKPAAGVGAAFGFMYGGPIGAVMGAVGAAMASKKKGPAGDVARTTAKAAGACPLVSQCPLSTSSSPPEL